MIVDCGIYRDGRRLEGPEDFSAALTEARAAGGFVWVGLHEPSAREFELVSREFALHALAVEDALKAHQRPKMEVYDDSLFVVLKSVVHHPRRDAVATGEIMVFLGDAFVVTVRHGEDAGLAAVRSRLEREPALLGKGPTAVLYAIADTVVDHYLDVATELQTDLEELEAEVFSPTGRARGTSPRGSTRSSGRSRSSGGPRCRWGRRWPVWAARARPPSPRPCPSSTTRPGPSSGTSATTSPG